MRKSFIHGIATLVAPLVLSGAVFANPSAPNKLELGAPIKVVVTPTNQPNYAYQLSEGAQAPQRRPLIFSLLNFKFTPEQKASFIAIQTSQQPLSLLTDDSASNMPTSVKLGMNGVPVLNQGQHGTCATFATTAALDAILYHRDYISQASLLNLANYLENYSYLPSGWDGSIGEYILNRIIEFGVTKKTDPNDYPLDEDTIPSPISPEKYAKISYDIANNFFWYSLLNMNERMEWTPSETPSKSLAVLNAVKATLANASNSKTRDARITFGVLLPANHCKEYAGACAKYHAKYDTWVMTDEISKDKNIDFGGHEMVITGYDDNAIAIDKDGKRHKGLLIIRNSWSDKSGDHGDFYMSYDFFRSFTDSVYVLRK